MRNILAVIFGLVFLVGFVGYAEAAKKLVHTQAACDTHCAKMTNGKRGGKKYEYCMGQCLNPR
jgi:hypothetical protein